MTAYIDQDLVKDGIMPGGLRVRRRAKRLHDELTIDAQRNVHNQLHVTHWLSVCAMAVNEENATGGRCDGPYQRSCRLIPAVVRCWKQFQKQTQQASARFC